MTLGFVFSKVAMALKKLKLGPICVRVFQGNYATNVYNEIYMHNEIYKRSCKRSKSRVYIVGRCKLLPISSIILNKIGSLRLPHRGEYFVFRF